ncbi:MAG: alpha/beta fold hydrolase [Pacificimonas sp.]
MKPAWTPPADSGMTARTIAANQLTFDLVEANPKGDRLAVMLHGFPELNFSWRHQIEALADAGWRVWAPNQRGYGGSSKPQGKAAYDLDHLIADIAALIEAARSERSATEVMLVAHDWGGAVAWDYAVRKTLPLDRLIVMNMPHLQTFRASLKTSKAQRRRSWYTLFFQLPWLPEWALTRNDAEAIRRAFLDWTSAQENFPPEVLDTYARAAQRPGAMTAMINWYRAAFAKRNRRRMDARTDADWCVDVPTLLIWGDDDQALGPETLGGIERYVPYLTRRHLPGVSHWVQQDRPEEVNRVMLDWLAKE